MLRSPLSNAESCLSIATPNLCQCRLKVLLASRSRERRKMTSTPTSCKGSDAVAHWIEDNLGAGKVTKKDFIGSSSWSTAYAYRTEDNQRYFVKTGLGQSVSMFRGEALGLQAMYNTRTLRIPKVYHYGELSSLPGEGKGAFIVMEYLQFGGRIDQEQLGRKLAQMHLAPVEDPRAQEGNFGFEVDNTIGGTSQPNGWTDDWVQFFREKRLRHQLQLMNDTRMNQLAEKLLPNLERFFEGIQVKPCLLHGDLWSGNISSVSGEPAILDPAVYYGHHEAEWGMSWCASLGAGFWRGYRELCPKDPGFEDRRQLYELYHIMNHCNLFGGSYCSQAESIMSSLVRKL